jgi:hypothetical protein
LKFGGKAGAEIRRHADVAIGHGNQLMACLVEHEFQAEDLGVRIRRLAGEDQFARNGRIFRHQPAHHGYGGIGFPTHREEHFKIRVVLFKIATQVLFEAFIQTG